MHQHAQSRGFPLRVMFELTYACNFFCKHCYVPPSYKEKSKRDELSTKEVFYVLDQLADIGCLYLGFTGGEPFMRPDIMDIFWYAKRKGFEIIIYTNGYFIDQRIAAELARLGPNKVDITIPAISRSAFERICGVAGCKERIFRAIELLHQQKVPLGFKSCVLKENQDEIKMIEEYAQLLGIPYRLDNILSPRLDGSKEPYRYRGYCQDETYAEARQGKTEFINCDIKKGNPKRISQNLFSCGVGQTQAAITPLGELKMCVMIDYPKYKIHTEERKQSTGNGEQVVSLKEAWERMKELVASIQIDESFQCNKCELAPDCRWCPARGWLESKNFLSCDPQNKQFAQLRKERYELVC